MILFLKNVIVKAACKRNYFAKAKSELSIQALKVWHTTVQIPPPPPKKKKNNTIIYEIAKR